MSVLVALPVTACLVVALLLVLVRRDGTEREMAAFDEGQKALGRVSRRSPRATI